MADEMAAAHARDSQAERAYRKMARDLDLLHSTYSGRMSARTITAVREAAEALRKDADHIVRAWD